MERYVWWLIDGMLLLLELNRAFIFETEAPRRQMHKPPQWIFFKYLAVKVPQRSFLWTPRSKANGFSSEPHC